MKNFYLALGAAVMVWIVIIGVGLLGLILQGTINNVFIAQTEKGMEYDACVKTYQSWFNASSTTIQEANGSIIFIDGCPPSPYLNVF